MSQTVISVESLSKVYRLGSIGSSTLRADLSRGWARLRGRPDPTLKVGAVRQPRQEDGIFWALREINFEVQRGEVLGIIGANGAGKSTLLKILSRITAPTSGEVKLKGRIASLLEVGTGFHPDLTGRENVFLNGAILGMSKAETRKKIDEIVDFSGVEEFIDTPVKRYSSGMYVRLAFAVAAHLEPDILVLDEVLAVGDTQFQNKCLGKMGEVARAGRTVLFVSHNMSAIQRLCTSAVLLVGGRISMAGSPSDTAAAYVGRAGSRSALGWRRTDPPLDQPHFLSVSLCDHQDKPLESVSTATGVSVVMEYVIPRDYPFVQVGVGLLDATGEEIFGSAPQDSQQASPSSAGCYRATVFYPREIFMAKSYGIRVALFEPGRGPCEILDNAIRFSVHEVASLCNNSPGGRRGVVAIQCKWSIQRKESV
jgi:lipopolysaccharide transport system ATP-binding protein